MEKELTEEELNLRLMKKVDKYADWQYDAIESYLSGNVLEIGGGTGTITQRLVRHPQIKTLTVTETNPNNLRELRKSFKNKISLSDKNLETAVPAGFKDAFDAVVSVNVLEHSKKDKQLFANCCQCLKKRGRLIHFVPAKKFLFGTLDEAANHHRRYEPNDLKVMAKQNNLKILKLDYMNFFGVLGWLYHGKILKLRVHREGDLALFNKIVPFARKLEEFLPIPFGLSLVFIAEKN